MLRVKIIWCSQLASATGDLPVESASLYKARQADKDKLLWLAILMFVVIKIVFEIVTSKPLFVHGDLPFRVLPATPVLGCIGAIGTWVWTRQGKRFHQKQMISAGDHEARSGDYVVNLGSAEEELLAPLPNIYFGGAYALQENLIFYYGGGWMSLTYGDYDGELYFARGTLEYWPFDHVGLGVGCAYTQADIEYVTNNKKERYNLKMPGPMIYLAVGF